MRCFYHPERDAVGSCKSCGKGVCTDCALDLGKGLACRGKCDADAKALIELIERNIRISARAEVSLARSQKVLSTSAIFNLAVGTIFVIWGMTDLDRLSLLLVLGACFLVYGVIGLLRAKAKKDGSGEAK